MASLFEDASLVMIPSGYKDGKVYSIKPTNGDGDLTFTRSNDTATRVGPDGLIEKVRTNLVLQSNSFDTTWTNLNSTETSGQSGYDGTNTAWLLEKTAASGHIRQNIAVSGVQTYSVYLKAGNKNWAVLEAVSIGNSYFDLTNGVVGNSSLTLLSKNIVSVGNGWYRCSISYDSTISQVRIFPADGNGDLSGTSGNILIQAAQVETGDIATDYIPTTTAAVSVGPVANLPRLDYLDSSCPKLLLEPQRTNLALYSEQFDNAAWTKAATLSLTANAATSPDGTTSADLIYANASSSNCVIFNAVTTTASTVYTNSLFVKASGKSWIFIRGVNDANGAWFNTSTGVLGAVGSGVTATITSFGNGWHRCSVTQTASTTTGRLVVLTVDANSSTAVTPSGTDGSLIWGATIEAGSYSTSYIPTLSAASTRGADSAYKTGISSLIGQTEGTLFCEVSGESLQQNSRYMSISDFADPDKRLTIYQSGIVTRLINVYCSAGATFNITYSPPAGTLKIAVGYKSGDYVLYVNGVNAATSTESAVVACSDLGLGVNEYLGTTNPPSVGYSQALLFKTRLTDAECIELTTI